MSDLRTRILAAIEHGEQTARSAGGDEWDYQCISLHMDGTSSGPVRPVTGGPAVAHVSTGHYGEHIALHDPAAELRRYAAARRVLDRHDEYEGRCITCMEWCECDENARVGDCTCRGNQPWPCPDVLDLADSLGVAP